MQAEYALAYLSLYRTHWWWRAREDYLVSVLDRHLPKGAHRRILDVGCAGGLFFERLAQFGEVHGVETDTTFRTGDAGIDSRIHWGPLEDYPASHPFTCVLMLDVLEHLTEPVAALRHARARLAPNGILVATVPAFQMLWTAHDEVNQHVRRYSRRALRSLLSEAGFRIEVLRYFFHWVFPAKLLVRATEALRSVGSEPTAIPTIPPSPVNKVLYAISRIEQASLGRLAVPFGSSLLAVASDGSRVTDWER